MKNIKFISSYSGAGFKIAHHAGVKEEQEKKLDDNYIEVAKYGVSSGTLIQFASSLAGIDSMRKYATNYKASDVFVESPNTFKGNVYAAMRVLKGKIHLYDQSQLKYLLKEIVSERMFNRWARDSGSCPVHAVCTDFESAELVDFNLKDMDYDSALDAVMASASIPFFTKPINIDGRVLVDGGLRTHCASPLALKKYGSQIDMCLSVFSRPNEIIDYYWDMIDEKFGKIPILDVLKRILDIMNLDVSNSDDVIADNMCDEMGILHKKVFTEDILGEGVYKSTIKEQLEWYRMGQKQFLKLDFNDNE